MSVFAHFTAVEFPVSLCIFLVGLASGFAVSYLVKGDLTHRVWQSRFKG